MVTEENIQPKFPIICVLQSKNKSDKNNSTILSYIYTNNHNLSGELNWVPLAITVEMWSSSQVFNSLCISKYLGAASVKVTVLEPENYASAFASHIMEQFLIFTFKQFLLVFCLREHHNYLNYWREKMFIFILSVYFYIFSKILIWHLLF